MERILIKAEKRIFICILILVSCWANPVFAQELITGRKARNYIGNFAKKFSAGTYTVKVLERNLPNPVTQSKVDGVVFNAQSGSFSYIRRRDGNHILVLLSYKKTAAEKINADNTAEFEQTVKDNKLVPRILLDKEGAELAIVYTPAASKITSRQRKDKSVYLEIKTSDFKEKAFIREKQDSLE